MKTTVTLSSFRDSFQAMGRGDQFTYRGLEALFDFLEEMEETEGAEMELDVIGLCCDYSEYATATECALAYGYDSPSETQAKEWLLENTILIEFKGGVIIQNF